MMDRYTYIRVSLSDIFFFFRPPLRAVGWTMGTVSGSGKLDDKFFVITTTGKGKKRKKKDHRQLDKKTPDGYKKRKIEKKKNNTK